MEHNVIGNPNLFDDYLSERGLTRANWLKKLNEVIKNGEVSVNGVASSSSSDKVSETSAETDSIFSVEGEAVKDSSSAFTSDDETANEKAGDKIVEGSEENIEQLRDKHIQEITTFFNQE